MNWSARPLRKAGVTVERIVAEMAKVGFSDVRRGTSADREPDRPEAYLYLQATAGSQRHFSLVKVLLWAQC